MSSYNDGAQIVSLAEFNAALPAVAVKPDDYNRIQLLTREGLTRLVDECFKLDGLIYGELSPDFPLCMDFAAIAHGDVLRGAVAAGLAVRPGFGVLEYTQLPPHPRHAINFGVLAISLQVVYYEPQRREWLDVPNNLKSLDRFRL